MDEYEKAASSPMVISFSIFFETLLSRLAFIYLHTKLGNIPNSKKVSPHNILDIMFSI